MNRPRSDVARPLLRLQDIAARCRVSLRTVQGWVAGGRLEVLRLSPRAVRVREEALETFLERASRRVLVMAARVLLVRPFPSFSLTAGGSLPKAPAAAFAPGEEP